MEQHVNNPILERIARLPWLHYWEQRFVGWGVYRRVKALLREEGLLKNEPRVLEIGCGQGILAEWFSGGRYVGVDTDLASLRFAQAKSQKHFFVCEDTLQLSFGDETFDAVISVGVLHHLDARQLIRHFEEALRVLRGAGKFIVFDTLKPNPRDMLRHGFSLLERGRYLRTESELLKCLSQIAFPSPYRFKRSRTLLLENYSLVTEKQHSKYRFS